MPLPTNLNTNEVKDSTGAEQEFKHWSLEGRVHIYTLAGAVPSLPCTLKVSHQETGTGLAAVRRSMVRADKSVVGKSGKTVQVSEYKVTVIPVGELDDLNAVKDVNAYIDSFCATTGAGTTVLFDGSGNGDQCLIEGTL